MRIIEETELPAVREGPIPRHVGCIMDGNGRWALGRGVTRSEGHAAAEEAVASTVYAALDLGISWLSVYAFSTENWQRPQAEVDFLMRFDEWLLHEARRKEFHEEGVQIRFLGRLDDERIPAEGRAWIAETQEMTAGNDRLVLAIAFNYGGQAELLDAVKAVARSGEDIASLTEDGLARHMYAGDMPPMDLLVRTSAEHRLSNFFLWHSAYAEFVFSETLWPDFRGWHLYSAVREYQTRMRRKGRTVAAPG